MCLQLNSLILTFRGGRGGCCLSTIFENDNTVLFLLHSNHSQNLHIIPPSTLLPFILPTVSVWFYHSGVVKVKNTILQKTKIFVLH